MNVLAIVLAATVLATPGAVTRVADDARVLDRVAEVSKGDLPVELLRRLVSEDIELLRGKRADGTYQFAGYERLEAGRITQSFSIEPKGDDQLKRIDASGDFVYRAVLDMPSRRLIVRHNNPVYVDRVEIELMPQGSSTLKTQTVKVGAWLEPGSVKPIELEDIGRHATVRVFARTDKAKGYGNIAISLLQAKVVDNSDSPYADAVESEKAILRALDHSDPGSIRTMAQRIVAGLTPRTAGAVVEVAAAAPVTAPTAAAAAPVVAAVPPSVEAAVPADSVAELQAIEDLLTGTDAEKRQGMDRLHQLIRRMRPRQ